MTTYTILNSDAADLTKQFNRILNKVLRYGWQLPSLTVSPVRLEKGTKVVDVELSVPQQSFNGWSLIAHNHRLGGWHAWSNVPAEYADKKNFDCEHCNEKRFRNSTYILEKGKGHIRVGSTCLGDFIPGKNLEQYAGLLEKVQKWMVEAEEKAAKAQTKLSEGLTIGRWLEAVAFEVRRNGWHKANEGPNSSAAQAAKLIVGGTFWAMAEDTMTAAAAIKYVSGLTPSSDFEAKVCNIVKSGFVTEREMTTAAAIIPMWQKGKAPLVASKHLGTIGEKLTLTGDVVESKWVDSFYGRTCLTKIKVGNDSVSFFGKEAHEGRITFTGKVKKHENYGGKNTTTLNFVKVL